MTHERKLLTEAEIRAGCDAALAIFTARHPELAFPELDGLYKIGFADGCAFICDLMESEADKRAE